MGKILQSLRVPFKEEITGHSLLNVISRAQKAFKVYGEFWVYERTFGIITEFFADTVDTTYLTMHKLVVQYKYNFNSGQWSEVE